jgi:prepilin-type processing-associated H-X9-DG protein
MKICARNSFNADDYRDAITNAMPAIAAALIALVEQAERKPQFVQISHHRIDVARIVDIEDFGEGINVWMTDGHVAQLHGPDKAAFLLWHEQHADVVRLDAGDA